jgi:hypothetical protein
MCSARTPNRAYFIHQCVHFFYFAVAIFHLLNRHPFAIVSTGAGRRELIYALVRTRLTKQAEHLDLYYFQGIRHGKTSGPFSATIAIAIIAVILPFDMDSNKLIHAVLLFQMLYIRVYIRVYMAYINVYIKVKKYC